MLSPPTSMALRQMSDVAAGRGYTGSAGWMQHAGVESILGLRPEDHVLHLNPCIPKTWPRFETTARFRSAHYEILVENPNSVCRVNGAAVGKRPLNLKMVDNGVTHRVLVRLG